MGEMEDKYKFTPIEFKAYEDSCKAYRDFKNSLVTAKKEGFKKGHAEGLAEGRAEGLAEGRAEGVVEGEKKKSIAIANNLKAMGLDTEAIIQATGLSAADIAAL
ncbi:MAG: hypothetical protein ACI30R_01770 [Sodaliphilus sp.]